MGAYYNNDRHERSRDRDAEAEQKKNYNLTKQGTMLVINIV